MYDFAQFLSCHKCILYIMKEEGENQNREDMALKNYFSKGSSKTRNVQKTSNQMIKKDPGGGSITAGSVFSFPLILFYGIF